jgi:Carboxypeptidase regulatory-like domain
MPAFNQFVKTISLFCVGLLCGLPAKAQTPDTGAVRGFIKDASGGVIQGASIDLENKDTGAKRRLTSDAEGRFEFLVLPLSGRYVLHFSKPGFEARDSNEFELRAQETPTVETVLEVEGKSTQTTVSSIATGIRSDSPELSMQLNEQNISNTPLLGRKLTSLSLLNSSVRPSINGGDLFMNNTLFVVDAGGRRQTSYFIDGGVADEAWGRQTIFTNVPAAAVQELDVVTNSFSAEYGRNTGSALNIVTKAGGNDFHGDFLLLWRPPGIEARAPLATVSTPDSLWQGSAAVTGPVIKDKTQFSLATEINRQQRDSVITSALAPGVFGGEVDQEFTMARLDHQINDSNSLSFRANLDKLMDGNPANGVGGLNLPSTARVFTRNAYSGQLSETATITPTLINQARVSYLLGSPITNFTPVDLGTQYVRPGLGTTGDSRYGDLQNHQTEFSDTLSVVQGIHALKIGADIIYSSSGGIGQEYGGGYTLGQFTLKPGDTTPIPQLTINDVQSYTQSFGNASYNVTQWLGSGFMNDDIRVRPNLTLTVGLRYDKQSMTTDTVDFAPRVGFAWTPKKDAKTVVRGGYGIYYTQIPADVAAAWNIMGPTGIFTFSATPGQYGFPNNLQPLTAFPPGSVLPARDINIAPGDRQYYSQFFNVNALKGYPDQFLSPMTWIGSLGVERQLSSKWTLSVDYVHQFTSRIDRPLDLNSPTPFIRTAAGQTRTVAAANLTRPIVPAPGGYREIITLVNDGIAKYDGLQVDLTHRFSHGFFLRGSYTYSHAINTVEPDIPAQTPNDSNLLGNNEKGNSLFDQRHRAVISGWWQLPFHVTFGGVSTLASGGYYNILTGVDNNGDGANADRPVVNGALLGRNIGHAQPVYSTDLFAEREFRLNEQFVFRLRAEGFNMFNRSNIVGYNATWGNGNAPSATFGQPTGGISSTFPGRAFQFSARVSF